MNFDWMLHHVLIDIYARVDNALFPSVCIVCMYISNLRNSRLPMHWRLLNYECWIRLDAKKDWVAMMNRCGWKRSWWCLNLLLDVEKQSGLDVVFLLLYFDQRSPSGAHRINNWR